MMCASPNWKLLAAIKCFTQKTKHVMTESITRYLGKYDISSELLLELGISVRLQLSCPRNHCRLIHVKVQLGLHTACALTTVGVEC